MVEEFMVVTATAALLAWQSNL
ncbi:hypothetical protein Patl1_27048 [Pistacia atlantica]|uniref:Uncharacterized protein n=1 Tax=Pistacia atlantica TaxID=434234 RepID=A0ACC1B3E1_9ROSI|nr:hypothetical protein Patl1_27048 [Pistacia atlantica]